MIDGTEKSMVRNPHEITSLMAALKSGMGSDDALEI